MFKQVIGEMVPVQRCISALIMDVEEWFAMKGIKEIYVMDVLLDGHDIKKMTVSTAKKSTDMCFKVCSYFCS